jgi:2-polyprenyl-3-methyl-5-hydroxy-6-metoxy-1,4-benzoquinol methylase
MKIKTETKINRTSACPLCESRQGILFYNLGESRYCRCTNCQLISVDPIPSSDDMQVRANYWAEKHHKQVEKVSQHYSLAFQKIAFGEVFKQIGKYKKSGHLLDVGCGIGGFVHAAQGFGWEAYGIDISPSIDIGKSYNLNVFRTTIDQIKFPEQFFDVITLFDVIEHIPDPKKMIYHTTRILRPGGCLFLITPNINSLSSRILGSSWEAIEPQDHIALYNIRTLSSLLQEYQYKTTYVKTIDFNFLQLMSLFKRKKEEKERMSYQKRRRRTIGLFLKNKPLQLTRTIANRLLAATEMGDKLIVEAQYEP